MSMTTVVSGVSFTEEEFQQAQKAAVQGRDALIETLMGLGKNKHPGLDYVGWGNLLNSFLHADRNTTRVAA